MTSETLYRHYDTCTALTASGSGHGRCQCPCHDSSDDVRSPGARLSHDRGADVREALTNITFAQRHLLGDSDVSRDDAAVALIEAARALSVPAPTLPAHPEVQIADALMNREALARALHKERGRSHWKRHPEWPCPNCDAETSAVLVNYAEALRDAV